MLSFSSMCLVASLLLITSSPIVSSTYETMNGERILRVTRAQCARVCGVKMTLECCDCIGCHQGMRFGKRSAGPLPIIPSSIEIDDLALF